MKKFKLLALILSLCLVCNAFTLIESSAATEGNSGQTAKVSQEKADTQPLEDENVAREDVVTTMDENANVTEEEDVDGSMEEYAVDPVPKAKMMTRAASSEVYVVNFRTKESAVTNYNEYGTGDAGYTNGAYGADAAYLGMSGGKVKFMMSGVVGLVKESEVEVIKYSDAKVVSGYYVENGRLMHGIVCNMKTPGYNTSLDNGKAPSYLSTGKKYYSYDGHYFYKDYATMIADYKNDTRKNSVNPNDPYYNYYQYLPLRSTTSYSSSTLNSMINSKAGSSSKMYNTGSTFVSNQNTYGVNALIMTGIAANESNWGNSSIAKSKNNLFGLNAVDSSPGESANKFSSVSACISEFANIWMSKGYIDPSDSRYNGGFLGNKASGFNVKYASDPYWGEKAANVAYYLDKKQGSKDYDRYTIGMINTATSSHDYVNIRNGASTSTKVLYNTGNSTDYSVLMLSTSSDNNFYKIQSDGVLNSGRTALNTSSGKYSFSSMYAYAYTPYVSVVNDGSSTPEPEPATLSSIAITKAPTKTSYTEGDKFDASGMKVTAKWSDGNSTDVTGSVTYTAAALKTSDTSVTVSYTSGGVTKTASQAITVKAKATVTEVKINPTEITLDKGATKTFGVAVIGTGDPAQTVTWTVSGATSDSTVIDENGALTIGGDESSETLTVRAVSTVDDTKSATATVTVTKDEEEGDKGVEFEKQELSPEISLDVAADFATAMDMGSVKLEVEPIDESSENYDYDQLTSPVADMDVLGVYDVSLSEEAESITLTFNVSKDYAGKNAVVLHYTKADTESAADETGDAGADDTLYVETYEVTVTDEGKITVTLDSLSPVVLAIEKDADADDSADGNVSDGANGGDNTGDAVTGGNTNSGSGSSAVTGNDTSSDNSTSDTQVNDNSTSGDDTAAAADGQNDQNDTAKAAKAADENAPADESAPTGDDFTAGLWLMLATAAALGATIVVLTRNRRAGSRR